MKIRYLDDAISWNSEDEKTLKNKVDVLREKYKKYSVGDWDWEWDEDAVKNRLKKRIWRRKKNEKESKRTREVNRHLNWE